jgi:hypothetical protein
MHEYFRQAIGYARDGTPYLFMKFRKNIRTASGKAAPKEPLPDNSIEYNVKDGGSDYFEFHCDMQKKEIFLAYVHGEA